MCREADRLDAAMPAGVAEVCRRLAAAGFEACAVGGAVRDVLLGREIGDWDVATSARPDEIADLFRRTIPTGVAHGTVTVLEGRGDSRIAIEVTTYRGEGAYSDGRHPDSVTFGVGLKEDLARRDFVMNAIAYDPVSRKLHDPFGGVDDLERRTIRAVGDPGERFSEDGLRVMRAARFAAVLEFDLAPATEAAIPGALSSLSRVSRERVRDELFKLLAARQPSRGLAVAARTGILGSILPELEPAEAVFQRVDAAPERDVRLAALLAELSPEAADEVGRRLRFSNAERGFLVALVAHFPPPHEGASDADTRRLLGSVGRERAPALLALWRAAGVAEQQCERLQLAIDSDAPVEVGELCVSGGDVMRVLGLPAGPDVGRVLRELMARVLEDPALHDREQLEALMPEVYAALR